MPETNPLLPTSLPRPHRALGMAGLLVAFLLLGFSSYRLSERQGIERMREAARTYATEMAERYAGRLTRDDFAALLSDATVFQFIARPTRDLEGVRLLGTSLMLNGIAMAVCGSSRPASGSEHLISHALDSLGGRPRMHGLQVGVATYLVSLLQQQNSAVIADLFEKTGFWRAIEQDPFRRADWLEALRRAPAIKQDFYTVLSSRDCLPEAEGHLRNDPHLQKCIVD